MNYIKPSSENIGTALGQGLSYMAQSKMAQMQQRQGQEQTFKLLTMLGAPENHAAALALAPKEVLEKILPTYIPALARQQDMGQQQQQPQENMAQLQGMSQAAPSQEAALGAPQADLMQGQDRQQVQGDLGQKVNQPKIAQPLIPAQQPLQQPVPQQTSIEKQQQKKASVLGQEGGLSAKDKALIALKEKAIAQKEKAAAEKEAAPFVKETTNLAKVAKDNDKRLNRMEFLTKKGYLGNPMWNAFLRTMSKGIGGYLTFGIDLTQLMTADAQEMEKLTTDFLKGAKEIFGNRITDTDLNAFLKTVPSLSQTNEGRMRVINNLRNFNEAYKVKKETMDQIIKENGGNKPRNLEIMVEERAKPELDRLAEEFEVGKIPANAPKPGGILDAIDKTLLTGTLHY